MICFLALGCGASKLPAVAAQAVACPRPLAPNMRPLDAKESVCSKRNVEATGANASAMRAYAEGLEAAVECYEAQTL